VEKQQPNPKAKNVLLGGLAALGIAAFKFKMFFLLLLKGGWVFLSKGLSMIIMIGVYTMVFGWVYAVMVVGLILIHEMGHYIFMKHFGLDPKLPVFIPFLGAYVAMDKMPPDQATSAWVSLAGPLIGGVTSVAFFYFGIMQKSPILMAAGSTGCFLNLLQLLPAKPLDGGFVISAIARWVLIPGVFMVFAAAYFLQSPIFMLIGLIAAYSAYKTFKGGDLGARDMINPATPMEKVLIGLAYFTLAGALGYVYFVSHNELISFMPSK